MDLNYPLPRIERISKLKAVGVLLKTENPEPSSRWLKRLRREFSDSPALGGEGLTDGDSSSSGQISKSFNRVITYKRSNSHLMKYPKEKSIFGKAIRLLDDNQRSSEVSVKGMQCWIKRWCCSNPQVAAGQGRRPAIMLCVAEKSKRTTRKYGVVQLPSIEAMAMMQKAMNNCCRFEFQRRGSFLVWKIRGPIRHT